MNVDVLVYASWLSDSALIFMGNLGGSFIRGKECFSFEYDRSWLKQAHHHMTDLRRLENAALVLEGDQLTKVDEALKVIFRPGATLGGARPKANVVDLSGALWIAKFTWKSDGIDIGGWEEAGACRRKKSELHILKLI